jgi:hypothetical protein
MTLDLSNKRHYTFPQLASKLECSEEDLRYCVIEGELTPSSFFCGGHHRQYQMEPDEDYGTTGAVRPNVMYETIGTDDVVRRKWLYGFHYLVLPTRSGVNKCEFCYAATLPSGFDLGDLIYELEGTIGIDDVMNTGVVMAVELDRFVDSRSWPKTPSIPIETSIESEIDPSDLPAELDAANTAYRAVLNGYGKQGDTPKNRLIAYLKATYKHLTPNAVARIATVANPDKSPGRMKSDKE